MGEDLDRKRARLGRRFESRKENLQKNKDERGN